MNASHRVAARTGTAVIATLAAGLILVTACRDLETSFEPGGQYGLAAADLPAAWVTGEVEFAWKGGKGEMGQQTDVVKHAMAEFNVFPPTAERPAKGEFYFRVYNEVYDDVEMTLEWKLHREVAVEVKGVYVDVAQMKGWFVGEVISDIKICTGGGGEGGECDCGGGGGGGHDGGCTHDDGGCTHDDGTGGDSGGCTHDDGTGGDSGGCTHDDGTGGDSGGCTHDDGAGGNTGGTGSCGGETGGDCGETGGGCSGGGHTGGGSGSPSGKDRTGQWIAVKIHDRDTPGIGIDGITWRWFTPATVPSIDDIDAWPHLCKKEILEGNLVIHVRDG
jgi:hypothetical protein